MPDRQSTAFRLKPLEAADFAPMADWFQNTADLARFDRTARAPFSSAGMEKAWGQATDPANASSKCWFAVTTEAGELCGVSGLESISAVNRDAVIALFIEESWRRQGLGIRAVALVLDFAFRQIGLNRITSFYRADNLSSQKMTARAGFETEGRMREAWFAEGRFFDMVTVGLLRKDWDTRRMALAQELDAACTVSFRGATVSGWAWPPGPQDPPED